MDMKGRADAVTPVFSICLELALSLHDYYY